MNIVVQFVREAWYELKKSSWLTRKEAIQSTWAVIVVTAVFSIYVAGIDWVLSKILGALLGS